MIAYDMYQDKDGQNIAQVYVTVAITKNGLVKFTSADFDQEVVKSDVELSDELKQLISSSLKVKKAKKEN